MCKQFIHKDIINKEAILQTLPSFKRIAMGKLVKLVSKSSLATFSGMLGTSSLSVPLKRREPRRRKTKKIRRKLISLPDLQTRTNRIKKREKQRKEGNVRRLTTLTVATMAMVMVLEMVLDGKRTLQTSILIRRRRERDGQRGRISRLTHKGLNLGVEIVESHLHLAPHRRLDLIQALIFLKKLTKSIQSLMIIIMLTIKMVKTVMEILIIKSIMMKMMTNSKLTYIQINTKRTMAQTTTVMPMKTQGLVAMVTVIAIPITMVMIMETPTLAIKITEGMKALMIELAEAMEILILILTIMVIAMDM